jgi:hypothetical protein
MRDVAARWVEGFMGWLLLTIAYSIVRSGVGTQEM